MVGRGITVLFHDRGTRRGWVASANPRLLYLQERHGTHFIGGWVGPRAGLDGREILSPPGFDPRTVQPVNSRYTDWATQLTILLGTNVYIAFDTWSDVQNFKIKKNNNNKIYAFVL